MASSEGPEIMTARLIKQIWREKAQLADAEDHAQELSRLAAIAHSDAVAAQSKAQSIQTMYDSLQEEIALKRARIASGASSLHRLRAVKLAPELLSRIFLLARDSSLSTPPMNCFTMGSTDWWTEGGVVHLLGALAAVNRHWRAIALRTALLWSWIPIPSLQRGECLLGMVQTYTERAGDAPLNIMMHVSSVDSKVMAQKVIHILAGAASRWYSLWLCLGKVGEEDASNYLQELLALPTPELATLALIFTDSISDSVTNRTLPCAPKLEQFRTHHMRNCPIPAESFTSLRSLQFSLHTNDGTEPWALVLTSTQLVELAIIGFGDEIARPLASVTMPALSHLTICFCSSETIARICSLIIAPKLSHLEIVFTLPSTVFTTMPMLPITRHTLTADRLESGHCALFASMPLLQILHLYTGVAGDAAAWDALNCGSELLIPRLYHVILEESAQETGSVYRFVRERNKIAATRPDVAKIVRVDLIDSGEESWRKSMDALLF